MWIRMQNALWAIHPLLRVLLVVLWVSVEYITLKEPWPLWLRVMIVSTTSFVVCVFLFIVWDGSSMRDIVTMEMKGSMPKEMMQPSIRLSVSPLQKATQAPSSASPPPTLVQTVKQNVLALCLWATQWLGIIPKLWAFFLKLYRLKDLSKNLCLRCLTEQGISPEDYSSHSTSRIEKSSSPICEACWLEKALTTDLPPLTVQECLDLRRLFSHPTYKTYQAQLLRLRVQVVRELA